MSTMARVKFSNNSLDTKEGWEFIYFTSAMASI